MGGYDRSELGICRDRRQLNGVDDLNIVSLCNLGECVTHPLKPASKALATMPRNQNDPLAWVNTKLSIKCCALGGVVLYRTRAAFVALR